MKILLDECLPRKLKFEFEDEDVKTVPEVGWSGKSNGELLELAKSEFDVFVTVDKNLVHQQNLIIPDITIVVLIAKSNRLQALKPLVPKVKKELRAVQPGSIVAIS